ncbi:hypothetical protein L1987_30095 [Smallanthus sonchifolius]|uniref:Uncharacterized protein n=1 Tax=Smallanthus sonchifolius TaxID=185202 RepID=A0ACB9I1V5_9ASTR|nr:hypothetical protein L1987_30095 [Smallanthus sonchifolius]
MLDVFFCCNRDRAMLLEHPYTSSPIRGMPSGVEKQVGGEVQRDDQDLIWADKVYVRVEQLIYVYFRLLFKSLRMFLSSLIASILFSSLSVASGRSDPALPDLVQMRRLSQAPASPLIYLSSDVGTPYLLQVFMLNTYKLTLLPHFR